MIEAREYSPVALLIALEANQSSDPQSQHNVYDQKIILKQTL